MKMPYNPVLVFKCQGEKQTDSMDNLGEEDFLLGIQTEFQKEVWWQCCANGCDTWDYTI